jgi:hypothetical protein
MEPLNKQKILSENPNLTLEELEEYEALLARHSNSVDLSITEANRLEELYNKIFPK